MSSKTEQILMALQSALKAISDVTVERNSAVPEKIPSAGLIILRDGIADESEQPLGGFGGVYCRQDAEIEIYVENDPLKRSNAPVAKRRSACLPLVNGLECSPRVCGHSVVLWLALLL
ncbi:hypothetical protein [Thalassospira sp.]|uniref:hypothetical protein n=1 Tax=Thalassospira sp. TaxID=1912094 RepID=UPI001B27E369|nr:hypothetical protein [Thalassospira sp.]MBO6773888.1 hypothetical protein [Thalassospira sp.]